MIDQARLRTLDAAEKMDRFGSREARKEIAMSKFAGTKMLGQVVDWAIQAHGAAGVSDDFGLARQFSRYRGLRTLDGPDEVPRHQTAKLALCAYSGTRAIPRSLSLLLRSKLRTTTASTSPAQTPLLVTIFRAFAKPPY